MIEENRPVVPPLKLFTDKCLLPVKKNKEKSPFQCGSFQEGKFKNQQDFLIKNYTVRKHTEE